MQLSGFNINSKNQIMKKIIIVDDDPGIRDITTMVLEKEGYEIDALHMGKFLLKNEFYADLIFLDRRLPDIDGIELCKLLKLNNTTKDIPVIMLSADPDIKTIAVKAGANEVMEKPFTLIALREIVARFIGK